VAAYEYGLVRRESSSGGQTHLEAGCLASELLDYRRQCLRVHSVLYQRDQNRQRLSAWRSNHKAMPNGAISWWRQGKSHGEKTLPRKHEKGGRGEGVAPRDSHRSKPQSSNRESSCTTATSPNPSRSSVFPPSAHPRARGCVCGGARAIIAPMRGRWCDAQCVIRATTPARLPDLSQLRAPTRSG